MNLWVPDDVHKKYWAGLPREVRVYGLPREGVLPDAVAEAEFFVPPFGQRARVAEFFARAGKLTVVQTLSAGVDWILPIVPNNIMLADAAGVHDVPVAEWVVAAILAMQKRLPEALVQQRIGQWDPLQLSELEGLSVMILGYGSLGRAVEARLRAFGSHLTRVARRPRHGVHAVAELPGLLPHMDAVVVLVPLTPETEHMVDAAFLARMKEGALLVNAARGRVVDTEALLEVLAGGRIRAALDVTDPEPLPEGHPLWTSPNLMITPHVAGSSPRFLQRAFRLVRTQVERYLRGQPLANVVRGGY